MCRNVYSAINYNVALVLIILIMTVKHAVSERQDKGTMKANNTFWIGRYSVRAQSEGLNQIEGLTLKG